MIGSQQVLKGQGIPEKGVLYNKNFIINYYYNFLCRMHDQVLHYIETYANASSSVVVTKDIMLTDFLT